MAKLLKLRRGSTSQHSSFTGAEGEVTIDTTKDTAVVHDGAQAGGRPLAREDMNNVSSASIAGRLGTDSIATSKIAGGALPTDVTVTNANVVSSAAIAGTKISPDFGSQNITTTGSATVSGELIVNGNTTAKIHLQDSNHNPDYEISNADGVLRFRDTTNAANRIMVNTDGHIDLKSNVDCESGLDVTGNITVSGTVDGRDVASDGSKLDGIDSGAKDDQTSTEIKSLLASDNLTSAHLAANSVGTSELSANAVTFEKIQQIPEERLIGRVSSGSGNPEHLTSSQVRTFINVENGATADQTASEIVSLVSSQTINPAHVFCNGKIGMDSNDYFTFTDNTRCDLYVNGNNEFRFEADGDFHADGDVIAQSTTISSDRKLKENIEVIPNALDKVQALNGVSFDWKKTGEKSAGVIAQEVQGVLPEAVKEVTPVGGGDSHLSVNYHALTSILIESIKELKAEIEELKGGK